MSKILSFQTVRCFKKLFMRYFTFLFSYKIFKIDVYLTLTAHLNLDSPHFQCSVAMGWLLVLIMDSRALDHRFFSHKAAVLSLDNFTKARMPLVHLNLL